MRGAWWLRCVTAFSLVVETEVFSGAHTSCCSLVLRAVERHGCQPKADAQVFVCCCFVRVAAQCARVRSCPLARPCPCEVRVRSTACAGYTPPS
eukprot:scaffold80701_cov34-Tisochrysis_lutea.AAC.1